MYQTERHIIGLVIRLTSRSVGGNIFAAWNVVPPFIAGVFLQMQCPEQRHQQPTTPS